MNKTHTAGLTGRIFVQFKCGSENTNKAQSATHFLIYFCFSHIFSLTSFGTPNVSSKGMWLKRPLIFSELREEDFYIKYSCHVFSSRGYPRAYFTLQPEGKNTEEQVK